MKTAVLAFGRLNPPTLGHSLLIDTIVSQEGDHFLYLSHSQDPKNNPLNYDRKFYWCDKAFGDKVNVVRSDAKNMYEATQELYEQGYTDLVYICGSDRAVDSTNLVNYPKDAEEKTGYMDRAGNLLYNFNSVRFEKAGKDRVINENDLPLEEVSAKKQRKFAEEGDLESFINYCPPALTEDECEELYHDVRKGMGLVETLEELHIMEAIIQEGKWKTGDIVKHENKYYNDVINDITSDGVKLLDGSVFKVKKNLLHKLQDLNDIDDYNEKEKEFFNLTNLKWNQIDKAKYSGIGSLKANNTLGINGKTFTPNTTVKKLDQDIPTVNVQKEIYYDGNETLENMLKKIVSDTYKTSHLVSGSSLLTYLRDPLHNIPVENELNFESNYDISNYIKELGEASFKSMLSPLANNFGEVFGSVALGKILGKTSINYPSASNYPLVDYVIKGENKKQEFKVSAKAGAGGAPTISEPFKKVYNKFGNDGSRVGNFFQWMYENIAIKGTHEGFVNMANAVANKPKWLKLDKNYTSIPTRFLKPGSVRITGKDGYDEIEKLKELCKSLGYAAGKITHKKLSPDMMKKYLETLRIRLISHVFIKSINNDDELLNAFNAALSSIYGTFIQVYLLSKENDFLTGHMIYKAKVVSADGQPLKAGKEHKYVFEDGSVIGDNLLIGNKNLSMRLK